MKARIVMDIPPEQIARMPEQLANILSVAPAITFEVKDKAEAERVAADIDIKTPWHLEFPDDPEPA